jgi:hypothetical protein
MNPEFTAYKNSPHSNVGCSECHVGPGASGFVMAKLAGTRQLISLSTGTYPRPIPPPEHMLPATETCERCHSPERFVGDRLIVHHEFAEDEANSATSTVLRMKVGGGRAGIGIHGAHMRAGVTIQYLTTGEGRKEIPQVSKIEPNGKITVFKATDSKLTPAQLATGVTRRMDCMDCHNRPTHVFQTPERALDQALASGEISVALPFLKREALAALRANYADRDTAAREIETRLNNFYRTNHAQLFQTDSGKVQGAVAAVQAIYARNVFPEMKVTWGTYPSQLGHTDAPGCFRCHDGSHTSADGRTISNDCATCHEVPAMQEKNPKILSNLGIALPPAVASASDKP